MKKIRWLPGLLALLWLVACTPTTGGHTVIWIDANGQAQRLTAAADTLGDFVQSQQGDPTAFRWLLDGRPASPETPLPDHPVSIQAVRPQDWVLEVDGVSRTLPAAGFSPAEALTAAELYPAFGDSLQIEAPRRLVWRRGKSIQVETINGTRKFPANAATVAEALSAAGLAIHGFDYAKPALEAPLPTDGHIQIVHIQEKIILDTQLLPFTTQRQADPALEVGQEAVQQKGEYGLALQRTRIRLENGTETARTQEDLHIIRPPQTEIIGYGTRIALHNLDTPYGNLQYWRAIQMYATSYSPCNSAGEPGRCYYQTASGAQVQKGVVAMYRDWYLALRGMRVYIPGYGIATIEDVGAGFPDGRAWIDLGYSDDDYQIWSGWVTVYFLAPAPAEIPWMLR